ncbi:MAG: hypothetical protein Q8L00_05330, partial [Deltaproteobacteria bacterium]|nr:hypothetical protein [Deltaproteobacteria bacterium]
KSKDQKVNSIKMTVLMAGITSGNPLKKSNFSASSPQLRLIGLVPGRTGASLGGRRQLRGFTRRPEPYVVLPPGR